MSPYTRDEFGGKKKKKKSAKTWLVHIQEIAPRDLIKYWCGDTIRVQEGSILHLHRYLPTWNGLPIHARDVVMDYPPTYSPSTKVPCCITIRKEEKTEEGRSDR